MGAALAALFFLHVNAASPSVLPIVERSGSAGVEIFSSVWSMPAECLAAMSPSDTMPITGMAPTLRSSIICAARRTVSCEAMLCTSVVMTSRIVCMANSCQWLHGATILRRFLRACRHLERWKNAQRTRTQRAIPWQRLRN
jgi:hypothetical protein